MIDILEHHIRARIGQDTQGLDTVLSMFKPIKLKRHHLLLSQGEVCRWCYFVAKGCVQVFVYDDNGNENIRDFALEQSWLTDINSFTHQTPSSEFFRTVEASELLAISKEDFQTMLTRIPQFERVYRSILEQSYANSVYRINTLVSLNALDRVRWVIEHQPKLLTRLPNKLVASYLGISPETLSRLKAKL
jgi:CRP-like cAMP-binding protein